MKPRLQALLPVLFYLSALFLDHHLFPPAVQYSQYAARALNAMALRSGTTSEALVDGFLKQPFEREKMRERLDRFDDPDLLDSAMRELRREVMTSLIVRDLTGCADFQEVVSTVTALAEETVSAAVRVHSRKLAQRFGVPVGISDHTLSSTVALTSVALGARIVEKHFILNRGIGGPDAAFSMEADEFRRMVATIRDVEKALGRVTYDLSPAVRRNRKFARSLFVVENLRAGDIITDKNVRSIRPADGLAPKYLPQILGHRVNRDIERGEPLKMEYID